MTPHANWVDETMDVNDIYKKDLKTRAFWKNPFLKNKFYVIFLFLPLCVFISIQNIGRSIHLKIKRCFNEWLNRIGNWVSVNCKPSNLNPKLYSERSQTTKMKLFAKFFKSVYYYYCWLGVVSVCIISSQHYQSTLFQVWT